MKRWLITALVALAILVLLAPGLIGLLAERSIDRQLELNNQYNPAQAVRELTFERGWFTSAGRHRVPITDADLAQLLALVTPGAGLPDGTTALLIETRLEHGLLPIGSSAPADTTLLVPALASGISTLALELPDGSERAIPGVLYSRVGLTGNVLLRYRLPAGDESRGPTQATWQAADLAFGSSSDGTEFSVTADLSRWRVSHLAQGIEVGAASLAVDGRQTRFGIAVGDARLALDDAAASFGAETTRLKKLRVNTGATLDHDQLNGQLDLELLGLDTAEGPYDIAVTIGTSGLQAALLAPLLRALQQDLLQVGVPAAGLYPDLDMDLRQLLSSGATLNIEQLLVHTPHGAGSLRLHAALPEQDDTATWPGLLLALEATVDVSIDRSRVQAPSPLTPSLQPLIAGGFLVLEGDVYRLRAEYANGRATVNGAPLVIPVSLFQ